MARLQWLRSHGVFLSLLLFEGGLAHAAKPCVQFDVAQAVVAFDVSTPEFLTANPSEKLIQIQLPVSSLVRLGSEDSLLQTLYVISGTTSRFQIVDYAPKTTLGSDVSGPISIEESQGDSASLGVKALVPHDFPFKADASASHNVSSSNSARLEKLPPLRLLAASGTLHRGLSAYFKLKPSTQSTLEGDKMLEVVARVPRSWRASMLHVKCAAFGRSRGFSPHREDADLVCGTNRFVVGVYSEGDESAKHRVWKLAETQQQLTRLAALHSEFIDDQRYPSLGHKIGAIFFVVKPRIPDRWLEQVLISGDWSAFERHLPRKLRMAATEYREARKQVMGFAGTRT